MVAFPTFFCKVTLMMYVDIAFYMFCTLQLETYPKCNTVCLPLHFVCKCKPFLHLESSSKRQRRGKKQLQDSEAKVVSDALAKGAPQVSRIFWSMKNDLISLEVEGVFGL